MTTKHYQPDENNGVSYPRSENNNNDDVNNSYSVVNNIISSVSWRIRAVPSRFNNSVLNSWGNGNQVDDEGKRLRRGGETTNSNIDGGCYMVDDFSMGDIVWAKWGKSSLAWPAIVIDHKCEAPQFILKACVANTLCVMFYGYSRAGLREYAWIKGGMLFPFRECFDRFRGQTDLCGCRPRDFLLAIKEAVSAVKGVNNDNQAAGTSQEENQIHRLRENSRSCTRCGSIIPSGLLKNGGNWEQNGDAIYLCPACKDLIEDAVSAVKEVNDNQAAGTSLRRNSRSCKRCGSIIPSGLLKNGGNWEQNGDAIYLCPACKDLIENAVSAVKEVNDNQAAGTSLRKNSRSCKRCGSIIPSGLLTNGGNWEQNGDSIYLCPACKDRSKNHPPSIKRCETIRSSPGCDEGTELPDKIIVVCAGMEGIYYPSLHQVQCLCGSCGAEKQQLGPWERHVGSRARKWKVSVKLKGTGKPLGEWLQQFGKQKFMSLLKEQYDAVHLKWTSERCAVCGWIEDWDNDKMIVCNRCKIAVHEECYGAFNVDSFSWVCRACETPGIERECCLCPVKGGALKPSDIENLWVHVTCAWSRPEVAFENTNDMEPAVGLIGIPAINFSNKCVICKQIHGACIQCCECETTFHAMCALRAGYLLELHCDERNGAEIIKWLCYCASHRDPHPDNALIMHTPTGVLQPWNFPQSRNTVQCLETSLVSTTTDMSDDASTLDNTEFESLSAARCRLFKRSNKKLIKQEAVCHQLMGASYHSLAVIDELSSRRVPKDFASFKERLRHLQKTESLGFCFGKSGIHRWGLFARRNIQEGEMIIEYRGELVNERVADLREARYRLEGKDCYFFKLTDDVIIDSTNKGNIARLINHSCMPNCYARVLDVGEGENRLVLISKTNVPAGSELTYDYLFAPDENEENKVRCLCNAKNCKKFIN